MTTPAPTLTLDVDLTNPGQFLACCGLLELASRLDHEATGWFTGARFQLSGGGGDILAQLQSCAVAPCGPASNDGDESEEKSPPVQLGNPFSLVLDWWEDKSATRAGFKTWSGGQTVIGFTDGMREQLAKPPHLFEAKALKKPKPFYFDSRLSRLTSLDLGFSPDGRITAFSPAAELLALIGMQRFRPGTIFEREIYAFDTWSAPLSASIAAAVVPGLIPTLTDRRYRFPLVARTGGKYKAYGPATLERNFND